MEQMSASGAHTRPHSHRFVIRSLLRGKIVPLLGAGASLCGRQDGYDWHPGCDFLPSSAELANHLASEFGYTKAPNSDLLQVSQRVVLEGGVGSLYDLLHDVFNVDCQPSALHNFLARIPSAIRSVHTEPRYPVLMTTNYDDCLERALNIAGEAYDLVTYVAEGSDGASRFLHWPDAAETPIPIDDPSTYTAVSPAARPIVLKVHGTINRLDPDEDSYVISEDHYIDYLANTDIASSVPCEVGDALQNSHFLFLGYRLGDWNLRVLLHRIWGLQRLKRRSWSVQRSVSDYDRRNCEHRNIGVVKSTLETYVEQLEQALADELTHD
jgi:hypothetical protein